MKSLKKIGFGMIWAMSVAGTASLALADDKCVQMDTATDQLAARANPPAAASDASSPKSVSKNLPKGPASEEHAPAGGTGAPSSNRSLNDSDSQ